MLLLSPGNTHDVVTAPVLVAAGGAIVRLLADKAYDTNLFRTVLAERHILAGAILAATVLWRIN